MTSANRVRFFVLSKPVGLQRVAEKRRLAVGDVLKDGLPEKPDEFYVYVRVRSLDLAVTKDRDGQRRLRCYFDEINATDNTATGRRGILHLRGQSIIEIAQCIPLPANVFLCNFRLVSDPTARDPSRISMFDIELEMDDDCSESGEIYKIEEEEEPSKLPLPSDCTELKNVVECQKLSVYGVIKSLMELENGNLKLALTDPSLDIDKHVICHLASSSADMLPRQAKVGDVLRLHRISAKVQHGVMKLFGSMEKAGLSWLVFDGTPGADLTPISSSQNFSLCDSDYETARILRSWFTINSRKPPGEMPATAPTDDAITQLRDFHLKEYRNVLLQVIGVFESVRSTKPIIIRGWDGTKCTRKSTKVDPEKEQLPIFSYDKELCEAVGDYAVDVFVYDEHRDVARNVVCRQFILMRNVHFYFAKVPDFTFALHGGPFVGAYGRGIKELEPTDPRVLQLNRKLEDFISTLPANKRQKLRTHKQFPEKEIDGRQRTNVDKRRSASMSPNFRAREDAARMAVTSSPSRNVREIPVVRVYQEEAGPSNATSSPPRPKKSRTAEPPLVETRPTSPRTPERRQLRSAAPTRTSTSRPFVDELRRPPLSQPGQRLIERTPSPCRRASPAKSPKKSEGRGQIRDSIYSQSSPVRVVRQKTAPRATTVSVSVETTHVTVTERSPRRALRKEHATPARDDKRPQRAAVRRTFFDEDVSGMSSSSSSSSEESSSAESGVDDNEKRRIRVMKLRNRAVRVQGAPSQTPSSHPAKSWSPTTKKGKRGTTPKARRGRK